MYPCASLPEGSTSLLNASYAQAWEDTKNLVDSMLLGAECVGCPYDSVCPKCPVTRLMDMHYGHCNTDLCELTRRMVSAGVKKLDQPVEECD